MTLKASNFPTNRPTLDLNFAQTKRLDPRVTFSRSSSGTYTDGDGLIKSAATNVPRFVHNPITGESLGLLMEEARTNIAPYSEYLHLYPWSEVDNGAACTAIPNSEIAPDGRYAAAKLILAPGATSSNQAYYDHIASGYNPDSATWVFSLFVKFAGVPRITIVGQHGDDRSWIFDVTTGLPVSGFNSAKGDFYQPMGNGWHRIGLGWNPSIFVYPHPGFGFGLSGTTGDGAKGLLMWGISLERGTFSTSYIPTPATFTGRSSTATFYDANGVIQTAGSGVARSNAFFPDSTGVMRRAGLLLENAATNRLNGSQTFATTGGTQNNWVDANITRDGTLRTSPDGTANALRVTAAAANATIISSAAVGTSSARTFSIFLRRVTGTGDIQYTLDNGATWTTQVITASWARYQFPPTTANQQVGIRIVTSGDAIELWGAQLEAGTFATSYIPTTTATVTRAADTSTSAVVTRAADVAVLSGTNFSDWWNASAGTFGINFRANLSGTRPVLSVDDNTVNNRIELFTTGSSQKLLVTAGGVVQVDLTAGTASGSALNQQAAAYATNDFSTVLGNATPVTDASGAVPAVTQLRIGANQAGNLRTAPLARLTYWPTRLSNATLQTINR